MIRANNTKVTFTITPAEKFSAEHDKYAPEIYEFDEQNSTFMSAVENYLNPASTGILNDIRSNNMTDDVDASVANTSGVINLTSVVRAGMISAGSGSYAKRLSFTVQDISSYMVGEGDQAQEVRDEASTESESYYAGLQSITIGGTQVTPSWKDSAWQSAANTFSYDGGSGYAVFNIEAARDMGTVDLYFSGNTSAGVTLTLTDSAGQAKSYTINISGVKTDGPNMPEFSMSSALEAELELVGKDGFMTMWAFENMEVVFNSMGSAEDPLVWFFVAEKFDDDSIAGYSAAPTLSDDDVSGYYPFTYIYEDSGVGWTGDDVYNFAAGTLYGEKQYDGTAGAAGTGYYRFTFYAMNYAGYITETGVSRYVKVDVTSPTNTATVTYKHPDNRPNAAGDTNKDYTIDPVSERGAFVGGPLTVTIEWTENISGNRVQIVSADGQQLYHVFVKDGEITKIMNASNGSEIECEVAENKVTFNGVGSDQFESVVIELTTAAEGKCSLAVTYTAPQGGVFNVEEAFTVYSNADMPTENYLRDAEYAQMSDSTNWGDSVFVYIDLEAIDAEDVELTDGDPGFIAVNESGTIPVGEDRNWYTASWSMNNVTLTLTDDSDSYASIYYITKHYTSDDKFAEGRAEIETLRNGWGFTTSDGWNVHNAVDGWSTSVKLEFGSDAGYYVTYVILVDGAMNKSDVAVFGVLVDVAVFGVLVDANPYKLSAVYAEGYQRKLGAPYVIGFVGADGKPVTADTIFHRGDEVTFSATLGNAYTGAYVPYKLEKKDANGNILGDIYKHPYNNNKAAFTTDGIRHEYAFIRVESDGTLKLDVDRNSVEKLPMLGAEDGDNYAQIVFSYRKLVDVKPTTDMTDYTGAEIKLDFSATDLTANKGSVTFGDGESPYEFSSVHNGYGFESILHAGTYTINVTYSEKESEFYVLNAEGSYPYTVNKGSIEMEVGFKEGPYTYGKVTAEGVMGLINYTITSGLVEADKENVNSFTKLFGASAKFSLPGGTGYIPAGSYEVNAVFTANDYDVTVKWTGSNKLTIEKRGLTVTAAENSWTYGDIPVGIKVTVPDTLGFGADKIAALFGVDAVKVSGDATSGWTVELPFAAVATGLEKNDGGYYNVGSYAVTGFTDALALDPNFTASIADGEGKIAITAAEVTVTPVTNAIRVTDAADLAGIVIAFVPTQDTEKFGVTGAFGVNTDSATGDAAYGLVVKTEFSSVHNDYVTADDADNVNINYNIDGVTVNVTIIGANGTFTITVDATTEYGTLWTIENNYSVKYTSHIENDTVTEADLESLAAVIEGYETGDVLAYNVGYYQITFTPTLTEGLEENDYIFEYVDADGNAVTGLTVTKKVVTVGENATLTPPETLEKEYGAIDEELAYSITITEEGALEGHAIKVGGIYRAANADGTARGGRYDDVGNYGIYADEAVFSDADNFEIVLGDVTGTFVITPKVIDFKGDGVTLYGTDKVYDSGAPNTSAPDARITLDNTVILNGDNVTLTYVAQYYKGTDNPVSTIGSGYMIGFGELKLGGDDAKNYTLNGVTIVYTDPVFAIIADPIVISLDHFTVGKTYDAGTGKGDTKVFIAAISELYGKDFTIVSVTYESADAGSVVVTVVLFFAGFTYPGEGELANYYNLGSGVSIAAATDGVNITISGITGTIAQREITLDDIKFLFDEEGSTYRTKVYDGTTSVVVPFDFEDSFKGNFAEGFDVKADAVLEFTADTVTSAGEAKNVGKGYLIDVTNVTLGSANYKLADAIEADDYKAVEGKIGGTFAITERPIELGIEIEDKTYDQSAVAEGSAWFGAAAEGESVLIGSQTYEFVRNVNAGTADAASYEPFPYVQIGNLDSGHYWHDVRVTLTVTTGGNFDWSNYDLQGYDVEVKEGEIVIVLEKAAYLDPRTISLTTENIKAEDKAYDGNTSATLDVSTAYETSAFLPGDADVVKLTYTAVFASPNAGTGIGITASGFKFVANKSSTNENAQFIADSYKTYTGTLTEHKGLKADITPKVLTATATLPGKTYDGTVYGGVDESKIVWKLTGFVGSDANNYSVEVLAAGYEGADVDADGNPNEGFVYGYHLVNNAQKGVMNYTIKAHDTKEYNGTPRRRGRSPSPQSSTRSSSRNTRRTVRCAISSLWTSSRRQRKTLL